MRASTARRMGGDSTTIPRQSEAPMYENILVDGGDGFATITINRPQVLNALSHDTLMEIGQALEALSEDAGVRSIIITGSGTRAFSAGADIAELQALESAQDGFQRSRQSHQLLSRMHELPAA